MNNLDVIIPTFKSYKLAEIVIRSFEKFKPADLYVRYIVVENSDDDSYRDKILELPNTMWIQNSDATNIFQVGNGSDANASGIMMGLEFVMSDYVFICHCDVCVTSKEFFKSCLEKLKEGYKLVGTCLDPSRINAIHISGLFVETKLAKDVSYYPVVKDGQMTHDVGDLLTQKCRDEKIKHYSFTNTFNTPPLAKQCNPEKYRDFHVDRCLDDKGNVMFMHLGRGIEKQFGKYYKPNRVYFPQWVDFCENIIR